MKASKPTPWHRLFGILLTAYFKGSRYAVEVEVDLARKKQLLDIVVIRRTENESHLDEGAAKGESENGISELPDGLDNLTAHNLITFKSHRESLNHWALEELIGHYVNYRKQFSPSFQRLLPESDFQLYAVCTRYPKKLASTLDLTPICDGVYDVVMGVRKIRIIVLSRIAKHERNAPWLMFSADKEKIGYAAIHCKWVHRFSRMMTDLLRRYQVEGVDMPYTMEDYERESNARLLASLSLEDRLAGLKPEDRLAGLKPEDRLAGLKPEDRLAGLKTEDILKMLKPEEIERYLTKLKKQSAKKS